MHVVVNADRCADSVDDDDDDGGAVLRPLRVQIYRAASKTRSVHFDQQLFAYVCVCVVFIRFRCLAYLWYDYRAAHFVRAKVIVITGFCSG